MSVSDPFFGPAFIDADEWKEEPVPHRFVHGGFEGTDTRFSFYFPPAEQWKGRFLQTLEGGNGGHETTAYGPLGGLGGIPFAVSCGAYLVESNQGHFGSDLSILHTEPTVHAYRASAQSARFSREVAAEMYGTAPHHGYVFGGSGGSARCILCIENAPDVWDGAVPFIMGHKTSWSLGFSVQAHVARVLGPKIASVIDATEPGGSGDPFEGLSSEQRDALTDMYRAGFPRGAETSFGTSGYAGTFASHFPAVKAYDPTYVDDFWSLPGYMGGDGALADVLVEEKTTVASVVTAGDLMSASGQDNEQGRMFALFSAGGVLETPIGVRLEGVDPSRLLGAGLRIVTGAARDRELYCIGSVGDVLLAGGDITERFEDVEPGDEIHIDNRDYLAFTYFHRHQVEVDAPEYGHFLVDGRPLYPQRDRDFAQSGLLAGGDVTGAFAGKMIVVQNAHDAACWPNAAMSYRRSIEEHLGDALGQHYRLWFTENAAHIPGSFIPGGRPPVPSTRLVDYQGHLEQALRDLMEWVEDGVEPPGSTGCTLDADQRLLLAPTATERRGLQPVASATANGARRADVRVGETVSFHGFAEAPPGTGTIIGVEWDFDGTGSWPAAHSEIDGSQASLNVTTSHTFDAPGTYYAAMRVTSHRDGDVGALHGRLMNLARVRVVVS